MEQWKIVIQEKNQSELKIGVADKWDPPIRGTVDEILDKHYLFPFSLFSVLIPGKRKPQKKLFLLDFGLPDVLRYSRPFLCVSSSTQFGSEFLLLPKVVEKKSKYNWWISQVGFSLACIPIRIVGINHYHINVSVNRTFL